MCMYMWFNRRRDDAMRYSPSRRLWTEGKVHWQVDSKENIQGSMLSFPILRDLARGTELGRGGVYEQKNGPRLMSARAH